MSISASKQHKKELENIESLARSTAVLSGECYCLVQIIVTKEYRKLGELSFLEYIENPEQVCQGQKLPEGITREAAIEAVIAGIAAAIPEGVASDLQCKYKDYEHKYCYDKEKAKNELMQEVGSILSEKLVLNFLNKPYGNNEEYFKKNKELKKITKRFEKIVNSCEIKVGTYEKLEVIKQTAIKSLCYFLCASLTLVIIGLALVLLPFLLIACCYGCTLAYLSNLRGETRNETAVESIIQLMVYGAVLRE